MDIDLGECLMEEVSTLDELVVEGASVVASDGKYLITPMKTTVASSIYATDLIGRLGIPTITYNPINRSLETPLGNPVILINGRPADLQELQSLSASDVLNVEYSNTVPAIYGDGACLINVRLKKRDNGGSWNIYDINDFTGTGVDAGTSLRYHQGSSSWLADGNFSYRNNDKTYDTSYTKYLAPQLPIYLTDNSHSPFNYRMVNASLQYDFVPSASTLLSAKYSFSTYNTLRKSYSDYTEELASVKDSYTGYSRTHSDSPTHSLKLYLSQEINKSNIIDINLLGTATSNDYQSQYDYYRTAETLQYLNDVRSRRYSLLGGLNYAHIFRDNSRLSLCYLLTLSGNTNRYPDTDTKSRLHEFHNQVFLEYRKTFAQRLTMYLKTGLNNQHFSIDDRSSNYLSNISQINLQWVLSPEWSLSGMALYQSFPLTLGQLDDHLVQTSQYLYNNGNPALSPSHMLRGRLGANFNKNNISAYGMLLGGRIFNTILSSVYYDEVLGAYLSSPQNGRYQDSYAVMVGCNIQNLLNMFTLGGKLRYAHDKIHDHLGWRASCNSIGGEISVTWQYRKWQIDYSRVFPGRSLSGYYLSQNGEKYDQLAVTFRPIPKLSLRLGWLFMFEKRGWTYWQSEFSPQYEKHSEREIHNDANWIRFSCEYTLDFGNPFRKSVRQQVLDLKDTGSSFNDYGK